jgi:hypothetical protein
MLADAVTMVMNGPSVRLTPQARAASASYAEMAPPAQCRPTSEAEQAVSMVTEGPCRPSTYDSRPQATLIADPEAELGVTLIALKDNAK